MEKAITKETMKKLQNGSDIRGVAIEGAEGQEVNLTGEAVNRIAAAFVRWLAAKQGVKPFELTVGIGHDSRITADELSSQARQGVAAEGAAAVFCGLSTTPSMFFSLIFEETKFDGSMMITASHLPFDRNGIKFFDRNGGLEKQDIQRILEDASQLQARKLEAESVETVDLLMLYSDFLCRKICEGAACEDFEHPLRGLHIIVDAGNGAGGFFADQVLARLGADVSGSQFLEPDGMFPNHVPNPEDAEAMEAVRKAVLNHGADLGLCFDTDADRMSAVLSDGTEVNRDAMIAMAAAIIAPDYPGGVVVTDSVTSDALTDFLERELQMKHHRFKRGYKNVINECKRLNGEGVLSPLAMETSGHGALSENYFLDDGAYLAVKLLIAAAKAKREGKSVRALIQAFEPPFESREFRLRILSEHAQEDGVQILKKFEERAKTMGYEPDPNSHEGVRLSFREGKDPFSGWMLLRMSLHDPLMPLNLEGNRPGDCEQLRRLACRLLEGCGPLEVIDLQSGE